MADKRKSKQKRNADGELVPTKAEYAVAKHLRFTLEQKKGKLVGMEVNYFIASQAVDLLLESKWTTSKAKKESDILFTNRSSVVSFCQGMLTKGMFHIANKVERKKDRGDKIKKKKKKEDEIKEDGEEKKSSAETTPIVDKKLRERKKGKKEKEAVDDEKKDETKKDEEKEKKKKIKPIKLEMADSQHFSGGEQYCVWIYDPVPINTFIIGLFLVVGAIAMCLFPLWPPEVRVGIYYLSLVGLGFVGVIIALIIIRFVVFCVVWCVTIGKHHFWLLPNLTEDVGFFDSFKPAYKHTIKLPSDVKEGTADGGDKTTKSDKDKNSDNKTDSEKSEKENTTTKSKQKKGKLSAEIQAEVSDNKESENLSEGDEEQLESENRSESEIIDGSDESACNGDFEVVSHSEVTGEEEEVSEGEGSEGEASEGDKKDN